MKEFMTRVSDCLSERWNDPVRRESRLSIVLIGTVAVVIIVLLMLMLWRYAVQEKEANSEQGMSVQEETTREEQTVVYMADPEEQEALRQEYLNSIEYLGDKVKELMQNMMQVQEGLSESLEQCAAEDTSLSERINEFYQTVSTIVQNLEETQVKLYDLIDIVQILDEEKLPLVQEQMREIRQDMEKAQTDIADIYTLINDLKEEDQKLWAQIDNIQNGLEAAMNENITEVNDQKEELQSRIDQLASRTLKYHFDEASGTLYLEPDTE